MRMKQFQRPRLDAGERLLIRICKLQLDLCRSCRMTVPGSAFIRYR